MRSALIVICQSTWRSLSHSNDVAHCVSEASEAGADDPTPQFQHLEHIDFLQDAYARQGRELAEERARARILELELERSKEEVRQLTERLERNRLCFKRLEDNPR